MFEDSNAKDIDITYTSEGAVHTSVSSKLKFTFPVTDKHTYTVSFIAKHLNHSMSNPIANTSTKYYDGTGEWYYDIEGALGGENPWIRYSNNATDIQYFTGVDTTNWTHVVFVRSATFRKLYLNNMKKVDIVVENNSVHNPDDYLERYVFDTRSGGKFLDTNGIIRNFRAFNVALSGDEINEMYNADLLAVQPSS